MTLAFDLFFPQTVIQDEDSFTIPFLFNKLYFVLATKELMVGGIEPRFSFVHQILVVSWTAKPKPISISPLSEQIVP